MKKYAKLAMMESMRRGNEELHRNRDYEHDYSRDYRQTWVQPANYYPRDNRDYQPESRIIYGGMEGKFRDRRGREHYNNGRFAPKNERMNVIGFDRDNGFRSNGDDFRSDINGGGYEVIGYDHNEMQSRTGEKEHGYASGASESEFTPEIAREWVRSMYREDGMRGERWSLDEVKHLMRQRGIEADPYKVWVAMNAEYSDRCKVNEKYGIDSPDYYLDSAITVWLMDRDAVKDKLGAYYEYIVKH